MNENENVTPIRKEEENLDQNVSGWLFNLLANGMVQLPSNQAENVLAAKEWLAEINQGRKVICDADIPDS